MTTVRAVLLFCGILSSLLYVAGDVYRGVRYEGYSFASQTISELSAIGAPSPGLSMILSVGYDALLIAFGFGVMGSAGGRRALRIVGILFVAFGIAGLAWLFAPMHQRGAEMTLTDVMHIALSFMSMIFFFAILGFGAGSRGARFRFYSIATIVTVFVFGLQTYIGGIRLAAGQATPWLGVHERIMLYAFLLWNTVLAIALLRDPGQPLRRNVPA
jgi:hypothetical protein